MTTTETRAGLGRALELWPRRRPGLPPGQRALRRLPRFSDKPLRWPPDPGDPSVTVSFDGEPEVTWGPDVWATAPDEQVGALHCVTTWSVDGLRWGGHRLAPMVAKLDRDPPPFAVVGAADAAAAVFRTEDLLADDVMLATHLDGAPLTPRHGAPLRLVSPRQYGYKNVKHVVSVDFRTTEPASTLGPKEHLRARVAEEERHARLPAWAVRLPYRLTIIPTALAADRALRNKAARTGQT